MTQADTMQSDATQIAATQTDTTQIDATQIDATQTEPRRKLSRDREGATTNAASPDAGGGAPLRSRLGQESVGHVLGRTPHSSKSR
jgi:hypothetical protein